MDYTPEIMEAVKAMAYGATDDDLVTNCGTDAAEVARIRTEYAEDIAARKTVLEEVGCNE